MRELDIHEQIERSINKRFRKQIWSPFIAAVKRYQLISAGDKIAVCISGGKDSMLIAKLLQMLQRYIANPLDVNNLFAALSNVLLKKDSMNEALRPEKE